MRSEVRGLGLKVKATQEGGTVSASENSVGGLPPSLHGPLRRAALRRGGPVGQNREEGVLSVRPWGSPGSQGSQAGGRDHSAGDSRQTPRLASAWGGRPDAPCIPVLLLQPGVLRGKHIFPKSSGLCPQAPDCIWGPTCVLTECLVDLH